ncbi:peptide/nickel transport system substrate-binding protein [Streptomyces sp. DSM 42143]|uniref:ABC transporter substrate-binding protein n=1 Tax=Streptomyces TaxID=1883 RepID=UPI0015C9D93E|nr:MULTISPECIES: ABC transporter substrate-binding protein [unclassified Streptomyces]MDN3248075.1 ABC transporter substrate-binding protein [Streptomyces sp. ZSW22]MDN3253332.1 ABC transporter substrate-binding protein [Streptomyces sp. MA25(2023)]MDQ0389057.1 peptide/nickel transport system substrate-binding protein [Streptomyces sp. DSM 42143]
MFNRNRGLRRIAAIVSISTLVTGCGILSSDSSEDEGPIVVGTTSAPSTLDPAASWDGSWELFRNVYQTLLSYPNGATAPEPDAAENCAFTDSTNQVYRCELRKGLTFSNGEPLDAQAVKHSIDRIKNIDVNGGPAGLLGTLERVQAPSEREVVFHLDKPDATFPFVLATPAMSIVEPGSYPADALREDGGIVGSGPYTLQSYEDGERAELVRNDRYKGFAERHNEAVTIRYFKDSAGMVKALRGGEIQVTYRGLAADDVITLQGATSKDEDLQLVEGSGTEIRYLVFNPEDPWAGRKEVRQAVAQVIDRNAIAHKIYQDTVDPLYSMVPKGLTGHTTGFFDDYGDPDVGKAREILTDAGITEPVPLTLWYTSDRYGSETAQEFKEIKRQLDASGLFEITLESRPWKTYVTGYQKGEYPVFGRGWSPDFPDAENFIAPFVGEQNALGTPYPAPEITGELLPRSRRESDRANVEKDFERAQQILVDDARLLPLWQGKQYVATSTDISGAERAMDPSTIMMMWQLYRKTSW